MYTIQESLSKLICCLSNNNLIDLVSNLAFLLMSLWPMIIIRYRMLNYKQKILGTFVNVSDRIHILSICERF